MTIAAQGNGLKAMAKQELVKIETFDGEEPNSTIFVMSMPIKDLNNYEKAKAIKRFKDRETQVLEQAIDIHLRMILSKFGVIPEDGSDQSLEKAFNVLEAKGIHIEIRDRYYEFQGEKIIGESPNKMTIIIEEDGTLLSCAMEIIVYE